MEFVPLLPRIAEETSPLAQDSGLIVLSTFFDTLSPMKISATSEWELVAEDVCFALIGSTLGTVEKTYERGGIVLENLSELWSETCSQHSYCRRDNRRMKIPHHASNYCEQYCIISVHVRYL